MSNDKQYIRVLQLVRALADQIATLNDGLARHAAIINAPALTARCAAVAAEVTNVVDMLADELGEVVSVVDDEESAPVPTVIERRKPVVR